MSDLQARVTDNMSVTCQQHDSNILASLKLTRVFSISKSTKSDPNQGKGNPQQTNARNRNCIFFIGKLSLICGHAPYFRVPSVWQETRHFREQNINKSIWPLSPELAKSITAYTLHSTTSKWIQSESPLQNVLTRILTNRLFWNSATLRSNLSQRFVPFLKFSSGTQADE